MSRARADEEEYWHSSKFRAFTFDDEDDELSQLKESKRAVNSLRDIVDDDDDDDDLERVSWSGEPVGSISWSIKETASSSSSSLEGRDASLQKGSSSYAAISKQVSSYSLSSLFKGELCLSLSALSDTGVKSYAPEQRRPKSEYKDYSSDWSPKDTVRRMQRGKVCSLERFRSLQDKLVLLDEAVAAHDGNVITAVRLTYLTHLYASLCPVEILFRELEVRQVALCHLIHFLKETGEQKLLLDLLRRGCFFSLILQLSQYREHLNIQDVEKRREFLKGCIGLPFSAEDTSHVQDHYTLLERQIIIEANDRHLETAGQSEVFRKYPRKASILNMPLVTTLFYSCFYHYGEAEGTFSSPTNLKKTFKIPDKQYVLTALAARAKLRAWNDVDALFTTKNWLGYTKKKAPIGFHRVVEILQRNNAPVQVLQEYVRLVEDVETRLNLATKYKCHDVVIETYRDLKDRIQLTAYKCKVERGSADEEKINNVLSNMVRNTY
ncbi:SPE39 protein, partial [Rhynochetos jubatus]|nr:SPE39 protein [Rhynochetos jubatus]